MDDTGRRSGTSRLTLWEKSYSGSCETPIGRLFRSFCVCREPYTSRLRITTVSHFFVPDDL